MSELTAEVMGTLFRQLGGQTLLKGVCSAGTTNAIIYDSSLNIGEDILIGQIIFVGEVGSEFPPQLRYIARNHRTNITVKDGDELTSTPPLGTPYRVLSAGIQINAWDFVTEAKFFTAGTAEQLANIAVQPGCEVLIKANRGNTGYIYLAQSKAIAEDTTRSLELSPGEAVSLRLINLRMIWATSSVNGEGIVYAIEKRD